MGSFQYEWWTMNCIVCGMSMTLEVKAKNKENAIKQFKKMADIDKAITFADKIRAKQLSEGKMLFDTLQLDRKGYQRRF